MRLSSLAGHCREVLSEILARPQVPADAIFARFFKGRRYLGARDRGFIADTVYGTLRNLIRFRFLLFEASDRRIPRPEKEAGHVLAAYLLGEGERDKRSLEQGLEVSIGELGRILDVLSNWKGAMANLQEPRRSAVRASMPEWLTAEILEQYGDEAGEVLGAFTAPAPITIRVNRLLTNRDALAERLEQHGIESIPCRFSEDGLILSKRMNANALPEFKEGLFELQDEGSQMLSIALDPFPTWKVFDACAGAGGKALHMAAIMKGRGEVVAHDVNDRRLANLKPRMRRSSAQNLRVLSNADYRARRKEYADTFDAVLIDAPCTGTGTLRRNPGMILSLDRETLDRVIEVQTSILDEYASLVKPGGVLFYATCSILRQENGEQVARFLERHSGWSVEPMRFRNLSEELSTEVVSEEGFLKLSTHLHGTDGFFGVRLRREG